MGNILFNKYLRNKSEFGIGQRSHFAKLGTDWDLVIIKSEPHREELRMTLSPLARETRETCTQQNSQK